MNDKGRGKQRRSNAPTMLDVAQAAQVSVATVSALINRTATVSPELTARIEKAIREIGYKRNAIARSLKMGTTRTIGLTVPHIANPFFTDVVSVIQQAFGRAMSGRWVVGHAEQARRQVLDLAATYGGDEVMVHPVAGAHTGTDAQSSPNRETTLRLLAG